MKTTIGKNEVHFGKLFDGLDEEMLASLKEKDPSRVVFIDTPPMKGLIRAIEQVREILPDAELIIRDHHDIEGDPRSSRDQEIKDAADNIRARIAAATISTRSQDPSCSSLIEAGEFSDENTVIIADNDPDGLTAAMKAAGAIYEELDQDSAILDGPPAERTKENGLSELGVLLSKGMATLPPFNPKNPIPSEKAREELFSNFVAAVEGNREAQDWLEKKVAEYEISVRVSKELADSAQEVASGVLLVNVIGCKKFDMGTLIRYLEAKEGCRITVLQKDNGPIAAIHGTQYSIAVPRDLQQEINLQDLLHEGFESSPESGIISNTTFLLHASEEVWKEEILPKL